MKAVCVLMPAPYLRRLQNLVDAGYYPNRAEAIRIAVRDLLLAEIHLTRSDVHE